jgi:hypothetical protein
MLVFMSLLFIGYTVFAIWVIYWGGDEALSGRAAAIFMVSDDSMREPDTIRMVVGLLWLMAALMFLIRLLMMLVRYGSIV